METVWNTVVAAWGELSVAAMVALPAWVLALMAMPVLEWIWGERATAWATAAGVTLQATTVFAVLASAWGWGRAALTALAVVGMGWLVEFIGSRTGVPFGRYHYTDRLQPQLGRVPLVIPLAWLMMLPAAWAIADRVAGGRGPAFVLISALAFTAWDLFLDPQMVGWRFWVWDRPGGYFGIPWVNFLGWALASGLMTAVVSPGPLPGQPLRLIYAITWLLEVVGLGVFWKKPVPAVCGFLAMGVMLAWAWLGHSA